MIELANAAANPKAMMVEFANASVALLTVFGSVRDLAQVAYLAAPVPRDLHFFDVSEGWL